MFLPFLFLVSFNAFSQTEAVDVTSPPLDEQSTTSQVLTKEADMTNKFIATKWDLINRSVDTFFTNEGNISEQNKSSVYAYTSFTKSEGNKISSEFDFQVKFDFPNTTKNLKIVIEKQNDDIADALSDNAVSNNKTITQDGKTVTTRNTHYTAGANYFLNRSKYFVSFIHIGFRLDLPLNPNMKLDLEKIYKFRYIDIGLLQKFILYRQEGFQEISQLSLGKKLNSWLQADFVHSLVYTDETDHFVLRHNLVVTQDLGRERTLSYSVGANAQLSPVYNYDSYDASISYRQLVYNKWLYGSLAVGANFAKSDHFDDEKFVQIRFDIFFQKEH
ncbi:MAG: hypothetical protein H7177_06425 [Rhizobacter sp.]|nr:hypothetical protein [Bacteriovorax sp.]